MIMIPFPKTVILTLLLAALASAGAGAQVSVSPASLEWAASSTGEEAVYVSVSGLGESAESLYSVNGPKKEKRRRMHNIMDGQTDIYMLIHGRFISLCS